EPMLTDDRDASKQCSGVLQFLNEPPVIAWRAGLRRAVRLADVAPLAAVAAAGPAASAGNVRRGAEVSSRGRSGDSAGHEDGARAGDSRTDEVNNPAAAPAAGAAQQVTLAATAAEAIDLAVIRHRSG